MLWGMRVGPVVRGILTYVPGSGLREDEQTGGHHTDAEYFYEIWIKHLTMAAASGMPGVPRVVAELGPGETIGCGLAALLSGAQAYYALDATRFTRVEENLPLFDAMVELFRRRAPRRTRGWPDYDAHLDDNLFPSRLLSPERMAWCLDPDRVARIRSAIVSGGDGEGVRIRYVAPWDDASHVAPGSIDFLFSHTVLQHVVDLDHTQECIAQWLRPGGWFSHQVDLGSMGLTQQWNGHRACPEALWKLVMGRRAWLINRLPLSSHLGFIRKHGMQLRTVLTNHERGGISRSELAPRWRDLADEDLTCRSAFLQGVRS